MTGSRCSAPPAVTLILLALFGIAGGMPQNVWADLCLVCPDGSGDFPTIQEAIDAASHGDIIELNSGTFTGPGNWDLDYLGKAITIRSASGNAETCIIDGGGRHRGFYLHSSEFPSTVLQEVTLTNCCADDWIWNHGGAIRCDPAALTILRCIFIDNSAIDGWGWGSSGGAVYSFGLATVIGCRFYGNSATHGGALGGAFNKIQGCTFYDNRADGCGGAIYVQDMEGVIENCTLAFNSGPCASGIGIETSTVTIERSIVAFGNGGKALDVDTGSILHCHCCDFYGNEGGDWVAPIGSFYLSQGNISEHPLFCNPLAGDFGLQETSVCAPFAAPNAACDLLGAWGVNCLPSPVQTFTWGGIKARFRPVPVR